MPVTATFASLSVAAGNAPTAIGIAAPSDSQYPAGKLRIRIAGLPGDGTVYLADGITPVLPGELLSVAELIGLTFAGGAGAAGQSGQLTYVVTDPAGAAADGTASLSVVANTDGPQTTPVVLSVAANGGPTAINIAAPRDPQDAAANLTVKALGLPTDGRVLLADGVTPVMPGQVLSVAQLTQLKFAPDPGSIAESSLFSYSVTDPTGNSSLGGAVLSIAPAGNILTVGPGQRYSTIAAAVAAAHDGDTIQVQAGTYLNDFAVINTKVTLEGIGGMVNMVATAPIPNGKAILVTNTDVTINNFSFSGAKVTDGNGAGIRYQAGNLVLNHDAFFSNQDGLLGGGGSGSITINDSEFANNGVGDPNATGYGLTHNLYVDQLAALTINNSYFHDANVGHEIKSLALNTTIQNSRIYDGPSGTASYSIDLPSGGVAVIRDNVIEQGPLSQNPCIISDGERGIVYANNSLTVTGNTILNDLSSPQVLAVKNYTGAVAQISGNKLYGLASNQIAAGASTQSNNQFLASEPGLDLRHPWSPEIAIVPAVPPPAPGKIALAVAADLGAQGDAMTVSGTGTAGYGITVSDGNSVVGTATVAATGRWTVATAPLAAGPHALSATQTDLSGAVGIPSATLNLTVIGGTPNAVDFLGTSGTDLFTGGAGDDTFTFSAADLISTDLVKGGGGNDTLAMTSTGLVRAGGVSGVEAYRLAGGGRNALTLTNAQFAGVTGAAIEVLGGANGNTVDAAAVSGGNRLVFVGGTGDDEVRPGALAMMTGGGGSNQFTFADIGNRTIADFGAGAGNRLLFRDSGFDLGVNEGQGTLTPKYLDASTFVADPGGMFTAGSQRFAYDTTGGTLYYDADGSGPGFARSAVVTLADNAVLNAGPTGNLFFRS
jgi:hypothetical protein